MNACGIDKLRYGNSREMNACEINKSQAEMIQADGNTPCPQQSVILYDMEAAAVYQAGACFFSPHQMLFLKAVSDHGEGDRIAGRQVERQMEACWDALAEFCEQLFRIADERKKQEGGIALPPEEAVEKLCRDMRATKAMEDAVRRYLHYLALAGVDYQRVADGMYQEGLLPCSDKREGKQCFAEFKKRLL